MYTSDWKQLALEMGRQSYNLQNQLKIIKEKKDVSQTLKNTNYTLEDEVKILSFLNEHSDTENAEKLNAFSKKDFLPLVKVLQRTEMGIYA